MGRIADFVTKRKKIENELRDEAAALQRELRNLAPPSLCRWKENELWLWEDLVEDGSADIIFTGTERLFGIESVADAKKKFSELAKAWESLVGVTFKEKGGVLKVCFRVS